MRYTKFQRRALVAVASGHDPLTRDVARRLYSTLANTQRSLNLLADRGLITSTRDREGPWHITPAGRRHLDDWARS